MLTAAIAILAALAAETIALDRIGIDQARALDGRLVATSFVTTPPYTFAGVTVCGAADLPDGIERVAVLRGNRLADVGEGRRVVVVGVLRVIDHPAAFVHGVAIPAWAENRVEGLCSGIHPLGRIPYHPAPNRISRGSS